MSKKQVTFADIAAYTHFSKTTISRYFNHPDSLTLENQEKISQALDTLGYKKNKLAKVLANGKSEFIGIIVPNLYLHYYSEMLTQFLSSYRDYHYKFLVFVSEHGAEEEQQYIEELLSYQIEGLIVLSHTQIYIIWHMIFFTSCLKGPDSVISRSGFIHIDIYVN